MKNKIIIDFDVVGFHAFENAPQKVAFLRSVFESKCAHLHGHNYRIHFTAQALVLDKVGRVVDFSVIKQILCEWLEDNYDHKFLIYKNDPLAPTLKFLDPEGVVIVDFNPTAENIAIYLVEHLAPEIFNTLEFKLISCRVEETRKCSATYLTPTAHEK